MSGAGGAFNYNQSRQKSESQSSSSPLTAKEMQPYWQQLNRNSGKRLNVFAKNGTPETDYKGVDNPTQYFSADFSYAPLARDLSYQPVSDNQLKSLGGAGATRELAADRAHKQALEQNFADAGLTLAQRQRSNQLENQDYAANRDAIAREVEAAITQAALQQAQSSQAGRQAQAGFDAGQWATELDARRAAAQQQQDLAGFLQSESGKQYQAAAANAGLTRDDMLALAQIYFEGKGQKSISGSKASGNSFGFGGSANVDVGA